MKHITYSTIFIFVSIALNIQANAVPLNQGSIKNLFCTDTACYFPEKTIGDQDIYITELINWDNNKDLVIHTRKNIVFSKGAKIVSNSDGSIIVKAGMEPGDKGKHENTVIFEEEADVFKETGIQLETLGAGEIKIYYNPLENSEGDENKNEKFKYHNPQQYTYSKHIKTRDRDKFSAYMLVNDIYDLQHVRAFLHGSYALSQNIDAFSTKNWFEGKGVIPLKVKGKSNMPFTGDFDGNTYTISGLYINRPDEDEAGLFGIAVNSQIKNLIIKDFDITGDHYVGGLVGFAATSDLSNIKIINAKIKSRDVVGGLIGTSDRINAKFIQFEKNIEVMGFENNGLLVGGASSTQIDVHFSNQQERDDLVAKHKLLGNQDQHTVICLVTNNNDRQVCLKSSPDEYVGITMPIPTPDPSRLEKAMVTIGSQRLTIEQQREFILSAEKLYEELTKKEIITHEEL